MYGAVVRFYNTLLKLNVLDTMKEDLIELITKLVFNEQMSTIVTSLCMMCTKDEERSFQFKLHELSSVTPDLIGLSQYFTLDETSKIRDIFEQQFGGTEECENDGDVGGSSSSGSKGNKVQAEVGAIMGDGGSS